MQEGRKWPGSNEATRAHLKNVPISEAQPKCFAKLVFSSFCLTCRVHGTRRLDHNFGKWNFRFLLCYRGVGAQAFVRLLMAEDDWQWIKSVRSLHACQDPLVSPVLATCLNVLVRRWVFCLHKWRINYSMTRFRFPWTKLIAFQARPNTFVDCIGWKGMINS